MQLDHVFICCSTDAVEADCLKKAGLVEGSGNIHPGQGTANRRFFFRNGFLELMWVSSPVEAQGEQTARTQLWERWCGRNSGACPFGIAFRPTAPDSTPPFSTWPYRPDYMPVGVEILIATDTTLAEPELFILPFAVRSGPPRNEPTAHSLPVDRVIGAAIGLPSWPSLSTAARVVQSAGVVRYFAAPEYVMELRFSSSIDDVLDLRPELPLRLSLSRM